MYTNWWRTFKQALIWFSWYNSSLWASYKPSLTKTLWSVLCWLLLCYPHWHSGIREAKRNWLTRNLSRFFVQVRHKNTNACIGKKHRIKLAIKDFPDFFLQWCNGFMPNLHKKPRPSFWSISSSNIISSKWDKYVFWDQLSSLMRMRIKNFKALKFSFETTYLTNKGGVLYLVFSS